MMTLTNNEIIQIMEGLSELEELNLPLNIKLSYNIAKNRHILRQYANIIREKQTDIYIKYGKQIDKNEYKISKENINEARNEIDELLQISNEIEITKIDTIDFGEINIPFNIIEKLLPIIENNI